MGIEARFDVARLVDGFESPSAMELLATVHWILERESPADAQGLVRAVHVLGEGKQRFHPSGGAGTAGAGMGCGLEP